MTKLWFWVNTMQLLNSLSLLRVATPPNVTLFQEQYQGIVSMEFLSKGKFDDITRAIFGEKEEVADGLNPRVLSEFKQDHQTSQLASFNINFVDVWHQLT